MQAPVEGTAPGSLPPGTMLGRYRIVRLLGVGGMGAVYEAVHEDLEKRVALKTLHPNLAGKREILQRFLREGVAASWIRHANAVDVTDVSSQDGVAFMVMEFLEGETLAARITREGALSLEAIGEIMLPVCSAVNAAHREGIVHRDLKPENIMLHRTRDGDLVPKVLDFGISKLDTGGPGKAEGQALTGTGAMLGTPNYMSPEQIKSTKHVDARSDQYSLGVILYECATGRRAFEGETLFAIFSSIVNGTITPPSQHRPDLSPALEALVLRAMCIDPAQRHASVADLARELAAIVGTGYPSKVPAPASATGPLGLGPVTPAPDTLANAAREVHGTLAPVERPGRARLRWLAVGAGALLVLGGGLAVGFLSSEPPAPAAVPAMRPPPVVAPVRSAPPATPPATPVATPVIPSRPVVASPMPAPVAPRTPVADAGAPARPVVAPAVTVRPVRNLQPQGLPRFPGGMMVTPVAPRPPSNVIVPVE